MAVVWQSKRRNVLEERFEVRSPAALPHGAEHPKPLDELNKQIEKAKAEALEAKGIRVKALL